jgi:hypothetical protein
MVDKRVDFFISRAGADAAIAKAIATILESAGRSTIIQDWDFGHADFVAKMDDALSRAERTITVLSRAYLGSKFCGAEWRAIFARDPDNFSQQLVLFRVEDCQPTGLLCLLAYTDLCPVLDKTELLRELVLARLDPGAARHSHELLTSYVRSSSPILHPQLLPTPNFSGRSDELLSIQTALDSARPVVLVGLGGVGKSALAREFGYRHRERYAGVWLLDASEERAVQQGFIQLGSVFIQGLRDTTDAENAVAATLRILRQFTQRPWLLILDNVRDEDLLRMHRAIDGTRVLATSRLDSWGLDVERLDIGMLDEQGAIRYLKSESGRREVLDDQWQVVGRKVDRLPLALSHVAAYLRRAKTVSIDRCIERIEQLMSLSAPLRDAPVSVYATYRLAIAQAEDEAPGATSLMQFLSFFRGMAMPLEAIEQPSEIYPEPLRQLLGDEELKDEALAAIVRLSLVRFDAAERILRAHSLVAAASRPTPAQSTWYQSVRRALYFPLVDIGLQHHGRVTLPASLHALSFEQIWRYLGPGVLIDLHAPDYGAQAQLMALGIFQTWDLMRLSDEDFDRRVQARRAQLGVLRRSDAADFGAYVREKRSLAFDHVRRGRLREAAELQLELCHDIHALRGSARLEGIELADDVRSYAGMARDSGVKSWEIAAALSSCGYAADDPFEVDTLFQGVGFDEQRLGMSAEDVKALVRSQSTAASNDPAIFLHRVDATLVNHGLSRRDAAELVAFFAQRMGIRYERQVSLPVGSGLLGSDAELGQCLSDALSAGGTYARALELFEAELRRRGVEGDALDAVLSDVRAQFLLR